MLRKLIVWGRSDSRVGSSPLLPPASHAIGGRAANRFYRGGTRTDPPRQRVRNAPAALPSAAGAISLTAVSGRLHPHQVSSWRYNPETVWVKLKTELASSNRSSKLGSQIVCNGDGVRRNRPRG